MRSELVELLSAAEQEAHRMDSIARQAKEGDTISMQVEQFHKLSQIIMKLCKSFEKAGEAGEWSPSYWVPLDVFRNLKRKYEGTGRDQAVCSDFILK